MERIMNVQKECIINSVGTFMTEIKNVLDEMEAEDEMFLRIFESYGDRKYCIQLSVERLF